MVRAARMDAPWIRRFEQALGCLLLCSHPLKILAGWMTPQGLDWPGYLPFHLCNIVGVFAGLALLTRLEWCRELTYFWGLSGTLQGVFTPDLPRGFPDPVYFVFFLLHTGVVISALYLVLGMRWRPRKGAVWRAWLWLQLYALVAMIVNNTVRGANYGFLHTKPSNGSLLDYFGPWPWYILILEVLALLYFTMLDLPFLRRRNGQNATE